MWQPDYALELLRLVVLGWLLTLGLSEVFEAFGYEFLAFLSAA